jgi:hypothetical protein
MDDPRTTGRYGCVQHGRGAEGVLLQHALGISTAVGERGRRVDGLIASGHCLANRVLVCHVALDSLDPRVVPVYAEQG